jgi:hypothetical protein
VAPEIQGVSDKVLPQSRLGLVDAHGGSAGKRCAGVGGVDSLFVECVAGFVHRGEEGGREPRLLEAGGDPHVLRSAQGYAERVHDAVLTPARPVVAEGGDDLTPEGFLLLLVEPAVQWARAILVRG